MHVITHRIFQGIIIGPFDSRKEAQAFLAKKGWTIDKRIKGIEAWKPPKGEKQKLGERAKIDHLTSPKE